MKLCNEDPRRSPRSRVFLAATLELAGRTMPVVLRDLSEHGALVAITGGLDVDSEVLFRRKDLSVSGSVAWVRDGLAGISFSQPLMRDVVLRHINRPQPRSVDETLYRRPGVTRQGMSADEHRWSKEILSEPLRASRQE